MFWKIHEDGKVQASYYSTYFLSPLCTGKNTVAAVSTSYESQAVELLNMVRIV